MRAGELAVFVAGQRHAVVAELVRVRGSSPRGAGTFMVIAPEAMVGTIGGGALEHLVVERARRALREGVAPDGLDIPLGPKIGQCCGGRVEVAMRGLTPAMAEGLRQRLAAEEARWPNVYLFGAGHVGKALARALAALPLRVQVIDTRRDELRDLPEGIEGLAVPMPEAVVRGAPEGSAYVILTHDHALDFLIAHEALKRVDSPYVGMVGSATKRARFRSWFLGEGGDPRALERLVLPIGSLGLVDKRPEVIAALAAAEIMVQIGQREVSKVRVPESGDLSLGADSE